MATWRYEHCEDGTPVQTAYVGGCALVVFHEHRNWFYTIHFPDQSSKSYQEASGEADAKQKAIEEANTHVNHKM